MSATALALLFASVSHNLGLPPGLLSAVCWVESGHNASVVNPDDGNGDSIGMCQLHFSTAVQMGYKGRPKGLKDPKINIRYAAYYLAWEFARYRGDVRKAVASYNSGSLRLNKKGQIKNRKYVQKVMSAWQNAH